jgi:hypothetical protein
MPGESGLVTSHGRRIRSQNSCTTFSLRELDVWSQLDWVWDWALCRKRQFLSGRVGREIPSAGYANLHPDSHWQVRAGGLVHAGCCRSGPPNRRRSHLTWRVLRHSEDVAILDGPVHVQIWGDVGDTLGRGFREKSARSIAKTAACATGLRRRPKFQWVNGRGRARRLAHDKVVGGYRLRPEIGAVDVTLFSAGAPCSGPRGRAR